MEEYLNTLIGSEVSLNFAPMVAVNGKLITVESDYILVQEKDEDRPTSVPIGAWNFIR